MHWDSVESSEDFRKTIEFFWLKIFQTEILHNLLKRIGLSLLGLCVRVYVHLFIMYYVKMDKNGPYLKLQHKMVSI